jgi:regulation of enolase protein 1 (concanavalin A-like superfamily)
LCAGSAVALAATPDLNEGQKGPARDATILPDTPWLGGWDKPVNPRGDCRFDRYRDKLTICVPGNNHGLDVGVKRLNAPRLLRPVQGDFVVQVRVGGAFGSAVDVGGLKNAYRRAGILLTDGKHFMKVQRALNMDVGQENSPLFTALELLGIPAGAYTYRDGPPVDKSAYLRVERRRDHVWSAYSMDGQKWISFEGPTFFKIPEQLQVGVIAETTVPGFFRAEFDQFKLSRP